MVLHTCTFNGTGSSLCLQGAYIITGNGSTSLRNYFTIAFTILQSIIPFVGALAIKRLNQRRALARGETVPLRLISSWLSVPSSLLYLFKTRRLPGRYWGIIMLLVGAFSWATHFLVNGIAFLSLPSSCYFNEGLVMDLAQTNMPLYQNSPPPFWSVSTFALSSQKISSDNRELASLDPKFGISKKANNDSAFYASNDDLLGGWSCILADHSGSKSIIRNNRTDIASQLNQSGLVYPSPNMTEVTPSLYATSQTQLVVDAILAWSANPYADAWDVKAAMMSSIDAESKSFNVTAWHCKLKPSPSSNTNFTKVLQVIDNIGALIDWAPAVLGIIKDSPNNSTEFYQSTLELYLNAIVIATGSHNSISQSPPDNSTMYNCVQQVTRVPIITVLAVFLEILVLLALLLFDLSLFLTIRSKPSYKKVEDMPSDVLDLQLAFVRQLENDTENKIQPKHLAGYAYGFDRDMLRFQRVGSSAPDPDPGHSTPSNPSKKLYGSYKPVPSEVELGPIRIPSEL